MAELPSQDDVNTDFARQPPAPPAWLRLMRPRQWSKNLLVFAALVFANRLLDAESVRLSLLGFASFCLASSSVYIVKDMLDVERDRLHPTKRRRPIA